jgi:hypothetical protein
MWMPMKHLAKICFVLLFPILAACNAPGEGVKAKNGYAAATPVIAALEAYHQANTAYPTSLNELVPKYISKDLLIAKVTDSNNAPFQYRRVGSGYNLEFSYTGPGSNQCVYQQANRAWRCYGAY